MRAPPPALARRVRETWGATGVRFPLVAARWLVRREYLVTARAVGPGAAAPRGPGVRWGRLASSDAPLAAAAGVPWAPAEIERRLAEGQEGWVAWLDGEPAHWRWETTRPALLPYLGRPLCPPPGDLCVVEVYTAPRFRGRGLHTAGTLFALERARARRLARLVGLVAWWNRPARRVMEEKTERTVIGMVGFWHLGVTRRYFAGGGVRLAPEGILLAPAAPTDARGFAAHPVPGPGPR